MGKVRPRRATLIAATAAITASTSVSAQVVQDPAAQEATAQAVSEPEILVTAQRRSENPVDVPISISAFRGETLGRMGITDTRLLSQVTPGLNYQSNGSSAQPVIRGVTSTGVSVGDSSNVALYVDGVYQPFQGANFLQFVDLERIEVLKGPQGTLYGRNAAGGAISITTLQPSFTPTGRFGISYGRFNELEATAYISGPLVADKLALSLSADYLDGGAFRHDINLNRDLGYKHYHSLRGKLLYRAGDRTDILLSGFYTKFNDLSTFGNQPLDGDTSPRRLVPGVLIATRKNTSALSLEPFNRVRNLGGSLKIDTDLDFATLTSLTAFSRARSDVLTDSDLTPVSLSHSRIFTTDNMVSQDLILTSPGDGPFSWIVGGSYYRERATYDLRTRGGQLVFNPNPPLIFGVDVDDISVDAYAVFGEANYKATDRLTITAGLRYSSDRPSFEGNGVIVATGLSGPTVSGRDRFAKLTPKVSVRYAVTPQVNAYASYSRGFKSGVFNAVGLQAASVAPETIDAYEIGLKGAPGRLFSFDASAYYYDYKNLQFQAYGETSTQPTLRNAAQAEIYGFETNATVRPVDGLSLRGGLAYTHGRYESFAGAQGFNRVVNAQGVPVGGNFSYPLDASGLRMIRTPRLQINGTIAYETKTANGGTIATNVTGSRMSRINYDLQGHFAQKAFSIVNASLSYTTPDDHWRGSFFGNNIFNAQPLASVLISNTATSVTYQRPVQYGVKLEYLF